MQSRVLSSQHHHLVRIYQWIRSYPRRSTSRVRCFQRFDWSWIWRSLELTLVKHQWEDLSFWHCSGQELCCSREAQWHCKRHKGQVQPLEGCWGKDHYMFDICPFLKADRDGAALGKCRIQEKIIIIVISRANQSFKLRFRSSFIKFKGF